MKSSGRHSAAGSRTRIEKGSGNVFADIGLPDPEEALAKSDLARQLNLAIAEQTGKILGIAQPRVSELSRTRLGSFSLEKLLKFAKRLGIDVEIYVRPSAEPHLKVLTA